MARPRFLTVLGNACADTGYRLATLPRPGETVIALSVTGDLGGKGLNQVVAAARAGIVPRFIAPVGLDAVADRIGAALRLEGKAAPAVSVRDSAGADDVFAGVFIAEWLITGNSIAAARLAVMAASTRVARPGTLSAFPTRSEIDHLRQSLGREPEKSRGSST